MNDACNRRPVHSIEFKAASSHLLILLNKDQKYFFTNEIKEQNGMFAGICSSSNSTGDLQLNCVIACTIFSGVESDDQFPKLHWSAIACTIDDHA